MDMGYYTTLTDDELRYALEFSKRHPQGNVIAVIMFTGLSPFEVAEITCDEYDADKSTLTYMERSFPVCDELAGILGQSSSSQDLLCASITGRKHTDFTLRRLNNEFSKAIFAKLGRKVGIFDVWYTTKKP